MRNNERGRGVWERAGIKKQGKTHLTAGFTHFLLFSGRDEPIKAPAAVV
jgi:hypothetical protein